MHGLAMRWCVLPIEGDTIHQFPPRRVGRAAGKGWVLIENPYLLRLQHGTLLQVQFFHHRKCWAIEQVGMFSPSQEVEVVVDWCLCGCSDNKVRWGDKQFVASKWESNCTTHRGGNVGRKG